MSDGSEFHAAGQHARRRVLRTWFAALASRTCCWKLIAGQYVLLCCWTYRWCLWDTPGICQCTWWCTVWSQYDSGSAASAAPSGLAWRGHKRPADEPGVLQRSGCTAVARVLTVERWLVLRYSSLASAWQVQVPAVSWLLLWCDGVSDAADAGGSSTPMTLWQRVPSVIALYRAGHRDPERLLLGWFSWVRLNSWSCSFLNVRMRTEPDDFRLVSIELITARGAPLSYISWALWQACL